MKRVDAAQPDTQPPQQPPKQLLRAGPPTWFPNTTGPAATPSGRRSWPRLLAAGLPQPAADLAWTKGCEHCRYGLIDPPPIDWATAYPHTTTVDQRRIQFATGALTFCDCQAGQSYRHFLTGHTEAHREPSAIIAGQRQAFVQRQRRALFASAGVPAKYLAFTFDSFVIRAGDDGGKRDAIGRAGEYLQNGGVLVDGRPRVGLFVHGKPGVGKTGLLSPLFLHYLNEGHSGLWVGYNELMAGLRDFESGKVLERIEGCKTVDYLFIDDFGDPASYRVATDYARDVMFRIVDHRNNNALPMFITSNLTLDELGAQFHLRLSRRIAETCAVVKLGGRAL